MAFSMRAEKSLAPPAGPVGNVHGPFITHHAGGKQPVQIGVVLFQRHQTVGGQQDGTVKGFEFFVLMPPGAAVVAHKMIILFKGRIVVGRQHLAVGVNIYTSTLRSV